ncbi:MAG: hypothetical protein DLM66_12870 [Candidatus Dormiibacter spiritus]|nr:MAG: hypothetical protein DLM66_12870 [Candidatus Dormibacteraeota bacterium]
MADVTCRVCGEPWNTFGAIAGEADLDKEVEHYASLARGPEVAAISNSLLTELESSCRPSLCALGDRAHAHCACGLPMQIGAKRCSLCGFEQFDPTPEQPSRRRHRISDGDGLLALVSAVFDRDRTRGVAA